MLPWENRFLQIPVCAKSNVKCILCISKNHLWIILSPCSAVNCICCARSSKSICTRIKIKKLSLQIALSSSSFLINTEQTAEAFWYCQLSKQRRCWPEATCLERPKWGKKRKCWFISNCKRLLLTFACHRDLWFAPFSIMNIAIY